MIIITTITIGSFNHFKVGKQTSPGPFQFLLCWKNFIIFFLAISYKRITTFFCKPGRGSYWTRPFLSPSSTFTLVTFCLKARKLSIVFCSIHIESQEIFLYVSINHDLDYLLKGVKLKSERLIPYTPKIVFPVLYLCILIKTTIIIWTIRTPKTSQILVGVFRWRVRAGVGVDFFTELMTNEKVEHH